MAAKLQKNHIFQEVITVIPVRSDQIKNCFLLRKENHWTKKNLSEQVWELRTKSTHKWHWVWVSHLLFFMYIWKEKILSPANTCRLFFSIMLKVIILWSWIVRFTVAFKNKWKFSETQHYFVLITSLLTGSKLS